MASEQSSKDQLSSVGIDNEALKPEGSTEIKDTNINNTEGSAPETPDRDEEGENAKKEDVVIEKRQKFKEHVQELRELSAKLMLAGTQVWDDKKQEEERGPMYLEADERHLLLKAKPVDENVTEDFITESELFDYSDKVDFKNLMYEILNAEAWLFDDTTFMEGVDPAIYEKNGVADFLRDLLNTIFSGGKNEYELPNDYELAAYTTALNKIMFGGLTEIHDGITMNPTFIKDNNLDALKDLLIHTILTFEVEARKKKMMEIEISENSIDKEEIVDLEEVEYCTEIDEKKEEIEKDEKSYDEEVDLDLKEITYCPDILDKIEDTVGKKAEGTTETSAKTLELAEVIECHKSPEMASGEKGALEEPLAVTSEDKSKEGNVKENPKTLESQMGQASDKSLNEPHELQEHNYCPQQIQYVNGDAGESKEMDVEDLIYCDEVLNKFEDPKVETSPDNPKEADIEEPMKSPQSTEIASEEKGAPEELMVVSLPEIEDEKNKHKDTEVNPKSEGSTDKQDVEEEAIPIPQSTKMASGEKGAPEELMVVSLPVIEDVKNKHKDTEMNPKSEGSTDKQVLEEEGIPIPQSAEMSSGEKGALEESMEVNFPKSDDKKGGDNVKETPDMGHKKRRAVCEIIYGHKKHEEHQDTKVIPKPEGSTDKQEVEESIQNPQSTEMTSGEKGALEEPMEVILTKSEDGKGGEIVKENPDIDHKKKRAVCEIIYGHKKHEGHQDTKVIPKPEGSTDKQEVEEAIQNPEEKPPKRKVAKIDYEQKLIKFKMSDLISCKHNFQIKAAPGLAKPALVKKMAAHLASVEQDEVYEIFTFLEIRRELNKC